MITAFTVQNFKAIGEEEVRIELKPITLLFGANSAGKSSILHALHYAYEVFVNRNLDVQKITMGENSSFDLGGFKRFIHGGDLNRSVVLRFDLDFKAENDIPNECINYEETDPDPYTSRGSPYDSIPMLRPKKLFANVKTAYVKAKISWGDDQKRPYVSDYETGLDGEWIARIKSEGYEKKTSVCGFNVAHPVFRDIWVDYGILMDWLVRTCLKSEGNAYKFTEQDQDDAQNNEFRTPKKRILAFENLGRVPVSDFTLSYNLNLNVLDQKDALPKRFRIPFDKGLIENNGDWYCEYENELVDVGLPYLEAVDKHKLYSNNKITIDELMDNKPIIQLKEKPHRASIGQLVIAFNDLLCSVLVAPIVPINNWLKSICYLGPLREIPSRYFTGDSLNNNKMIRLRWEKGLAAWDLLYWIGQNWSDKSAQSRLNAINDWLVDDQRLNTGYRIKIERYREVPSELLDEAASQLTEEIRRLPEKIRICLENKRIWLNDKRGLLTPHEIGVGISQVLPVVVAAVCADAQLVAIEQPELHLHPALQVHLGDLFIEQSKDRKKFFLIETHSEHLILRLMRRIREGSIHSDDVEVIFVEPMSHGSRFIKLRIDEEGDFIDEWPGGFFEESFHEKFAGR